MAPPLRWVSVAMRCMQQPPVRFSLRAGRRLRYCVVIALTLGFLPATVWSAPASVSFDDAMRLAVERAPALAARRSQTLAAREEAVRATALPDPKLTASIANWPITGWRWPHNR